MKKVYVETTVVSYLAARPSRDLIVAAQQQLTLEWWHTRRMEFELYVSQLVVEEASLGDRDAAERRLKFTEDLALLEVSDEVTRLGSALVSHGAIPVESFADAVHVAVAAVNGLDYLLTWNMAHILNAEQRPRIERVCRAAGFEPPVLCSPAELMGGSHVA